METDESGRKSTFPAVVSLARLSFHSHHVPQLDFFITTTSTLIRQVSSVLQLWGDMEKHFPYNFNAKSAEA